jgi:hypothetical protein
LTSTTVVALGSGSPTPGATATVTDQNGKAISLSAPTDATELDPSIFTVIDTTRQITTVLKNVFAVSASGQFIAGGVCFIIEPLAGQENLANCGVVDGSGIGGTVVSIGVIGDGFEIEATYGGASGIDGSQGTSAPLTTP